MKILNRIIGSMLITAGAIAALAANEFGCAELSPVVVFAWTLSAGGVALGSLYMIY